MLKHWLLLLAFATTCAAAATAKENQRVESGNYAKWTAKAVQALAVRADANSLATAAIPNLPPGTLPPVILPYDPTSATPVCLVALNSKTQEESARSLREAFREPARRDRICHCR